MSRFNFNQPVSYDEQRKAQWHRAARKALKATAEALSLSPSAYDLRSNKAGIAVSGEVTLHTDKAYVQVCQSYGGPQMGILIRSCKHRKDYTGGHNNFAPLEFLHYPEKLAERIRAIVPEVSP